jgi:hypothetical protein
MQDEYSHVSSRAGLLHSAHPHTDSLLTGRDAGNKPDDAPDVQRLLTIARMGASRYNEDNESLASGSPEMVFRFGNPDLSSPYSAFPQRGLRASDSEVSLSDGSFAPSGYETGEGSNRGVRLQRSNSKSGMEASAYNQHVSDE